MKVRDFWNSLPEKQEMLNKIKAFKELKRRQEFLKNFENCNACGAPVKFAHASNYLMNVITEKACCPKCGQHALDRRYAIN
jgi:uncharacterized protein (DUF983 family)